MQPHPNRSTSRTIAYSGYRPPTAIAVLALLGALVVAACGNTPSPSPSAPPAVTPAASVAPSSAAPSASAAEAACASADIATTSDPWGGAAGSRGSEITIENRGAAACLLPAAPSIALLDAGGAVLLSTPARAGSGPSLAPNGKASFALVFGNWCSQSATLPLHVRLALASDVVDIGSLAIGSTDELPPCNGPGQPASLSTTDWQPL
jgi:hypothetical protein